MNRISKLVVLIVLVFSNHIYAQVDIKFLIDTINWHKTESELVYKLHDNLEPTEKEVWSSEGTESNYSLKNVVIGFFPVLKSFVRVQQNNKSIYRLNLIMLDKEKDLSRYKELETILISTLGEPISQNNSLLWLYDNCKVEASFIDYSNVMTEEIEEYAYAINIEPINTFYVDWMSAIVESNNSHSVVPRIQLFRTDNDSNVYIKENGKNEGIKEKVKKMATPKGDVITFDGGMFCYRRAENDIIYILNGLAVRYPIVKN